MTKYLVCCYQVKVLVGHVEADSEDDVREILKSEESASNFSWLNLPSAEFTQILKSESVLDEE